MLKKTNGVPASLWIMLFAVLINVAQFRDIDKKTPKNYRALYSYNNSKITEISLEESNARGHWFHAITLSNIAPNSTIYIPKDSYFNTDNNYAKLYVYGKAKHVSSIDISASEILKDVDPTQHIVASGEYYVYSDPYFAIAMEQNSSYEERMFIEDSIVGLSTTNNLQKRDGVEFVYVEWDGPEIPFHPTRIVAPSDFPFYALFIEVSLLSDEVKSKILR